MVHAGLEPGTDESWVDVVEESLPLHTRNCCSKHKSVELQTDHLPLSNSRDSYLLWFSGNWTFLWHGLANIVP